GLLVPSYAEAVAGFDLRTSLCLTGTSTNPHRGPAHSSCCVIGSPCSAYSTANGSATIPTIPGPASLDAEIIRVSCCDDSAGSTRTKSRPIRAPPYSADPSHI